MTVSYDERVINQFAARLYQRAAAIVAMYVIIGGILGAIVGAYAARGMLADTAGVAMVVIGALGAVFGYVAAADRAFALRLQAQTALCQLQIERNTRPLVVANHVMPMPPMPPMPHPPGPPPHAR
jgi:sulfite exporter TauE/SafE